MSSDEKTMEEETKPKQKLITRAQQVSSGSATGNPRNKVSLKPGRSLMDWIRLGHSGKDLTGVGGQILEVTWQELAKHNTKHDAWIALKGKVYNVTPYMEYHPGGEDELMKGVGQDATAMFNKVHQWVNAESMLQKCLVGHLDSSPLTLLAHSKIKQLKSPTLNIEPNSDLRCSLSPQDENPLDQSVPSWNWTQTESDVLVRILVPMFPHGRLRKNDLVYQSHGPKLVLRVLLPKHIYSLNLVLPEENPAINDVSLNCEDNQVSKLNVHLRKTENKCWPGIESPNNDPIYSTRSEGAHYHHCTLTAKYPVFHNTRLFKLALPQGTFMSVPIGHHIRIRASLEGVEVIRNYTPVSRYLRPDKQQDEDGHSIFLMIKIYAHGTLTPYLDGLHIGEGLDVSDHIGTFQESRLESCRQLVALAAGTGFTPMVKLLQWAMFQSETDRSVKLMFFNNEKHDILWKSSLDSLSETDPRFEVCYVLSNPDANWHGHVGRIRQNLLEEFLPQQLALDSTFICVCGPTSFTNEALRILENVKISSNQIHAFQA